MNKIFLLIATILLFAGCKQSFLDTQNLTQKSSDNFPGSYVEADQAVTGIYAILPTGFSGLASPLLISEILSDDRFGGGGQNDRDPQAIEFFRVKVPNEFATTWASCYKGIFRANTLIASINKPKWDNAAQREKIFGEASFLRAYYYFDLARLFGRVPLVIDPTPANNPKASADSLFAQIGQDLKNAIDSLPPTPISTGWKTANMGRATKWAAEGILARAFLFYTGYYQKTEMPLAGGGTLTKDKVIAYVDDCIANSGASLVPDFRNMWPYALKDSTHYGYAKANGLQWVMDAGNTESIFEIVFCGLSGANWGTDNVYNNTVDLFCGHRDPTAQKLPFGHGWGFAPVNPNFYNSWPSGDLRKQGSVWNEDDTSEGTDSYVFGADMQWQETKLMGKKYIPININVGTSDSPVIEGYGMKYYGAKNDMQLWNTQNIVLLRLADVLLMGAELGSPNAQSYMDQVRARVKLPSVPVTLDNIKNERHWELAFEGLRYFDLLRWYGKTAGAVIKSNEASATIYNMTVVSSLEATPGGVFGDIDKRVNDTGGFLMIPDDQIQLSNGKLVQNPGWTNSSETMY